MRFAICCSLAVTFALGAWAQGTQYVALEWAPSVTARRGAEVAVPLRFAIRSGHHINSNQPAEDYLIPTAMTWAPGTLATKAVSYPKAEAVKYDFSEKPMLVYSGVILVTTKFAVAADAAPGPTRVTGKLRYQACNDKACFPPKTLEVSVPVNIQ